MSALEQCAPAGCLVCRFPVTTSHARWGPIHASCLDGNADTVEWLAALTAGSLGGCVVCRVSSMWHHPAHGPLHPACVRRALRLLDEDGVEPAPAAVVSPGGPKRGAYARRAAMVG